MSRFSRYLIVAGINTLVCYLLYLLLLNVVSFNIAYSIDYIFGIFFSYYLQLKFVFKEKSTLRKLLLFPTTYIVQYLLGLITINIAVKHFSIAEQYALIFAILIPIPIMYFLSKKVLVTSKQND